MYSITIFAAFAALALCQLPGASALSFDAPISAIRAATTVVLDLVDAIPAQTKFYSAMPPGDRYFGSIVSFALICDLILYATSGAILPALFQGWFAFALSTFERWDLIPTRAALLAQILQLASIFFLQTWLQLLLASLFYAALFFSWALQPYLGSLFTRYLDWVAPATRFRRWRKDDRFVVLQHFTPFFAIAIALCTFAAHHLAPSFVGVLFIARIAPAALAIPDFILHREKFRENLFLQLVQTPSILAGLFLFPFASLIYAAREFIRYGRTRRSLKNRTLYCTADGSVVTCEHVFYESSVRVAILPNDPVHADFAFVANLGNRKIQGARFEPLTDAEILEYLSDPEVQADMDDGSNTQMVFTSTQTRPQANLAGVFYIGWMFFRELFSLILHPLKLLGSHIVSTFVWHQLTAPIRLAFWRFANNTIVTKVIDAGDRAHRLTHAAERLVEVFCHAYVGYRMIAVHRDQFGALAWAGSLVTRFGIPTKAEGLIRTALTQLPPEPAAPAAVPMPAVPPTFDPPAPAPETPTPPASSVPEPIPLRPSPSILQPEEKSFEVPIAPPDTTTKAQKNSYWVPRPRISNRRATKPQVGVNFQQLSFTIPLILTFVGSALGAANMRMLDFTPRMAALGSSLRTWEMFDRHLEPLFREGVNWIARCANGPDTVWIPSRHDPLLGKIRKFVDTVALEGYTEDKIRADPKLAAKLLAHFSEFEKLNAECARHEIPTYGAIAFRQLGARLDLLTGPATIATGSKNRVPPVSVFIYGPPGTGKTELVSYTTRLLGKLHGTPFEDTDVWMASFAQRFHNGFHNGTRIVRVEEFAMQSDLELRKNTAVWLNMSVQTAPHRIEAAAVENKDKIYNTSWYQFFTSNKDWIEATNDLSANMAPGAARRRVPFVLRLKTNRTTRTTPDLEYADMQLCVSTPAEVAEATNESQLKWRDINAITLAKLMFAQRVKATSDFEAMRLAIVPNITITDEEIRTILPQVVAPPTPEDQVLLASVAAPGSTRPQIGLWPEFMTVAEWAEYCNALTDFVKEHRDTYPNVRDEDLVMVDFDSLIRLIDAIPTHPAHHCAMLLREPGERDAHGEPSYTTLQLSIRNRLLPSTFTRGLRTPIHPIPTSYLIRRYGADPNAGDYFMQMVGQVQAPVLEATPAYWSSIGSLYFWEYVTIGFSFIVVTGSLGFLIWRIYRARQDDEALKSLVLVPKAAVTSTTAQSYTDKDSAPKAAPVQVSKPPLMRGRVATASPTVPQLRTVSVRPDSSLKDIMRIVNTNHVRIRTAAGSGYGTFLRRNLLLIYPHFMTRIEKLVQEDPASQVLIECSSAYQNRVYKTSIQAFKQSADGPEYTMTGPEGPRKMQAEWTVVRVDSVSLHNFPDVTKYIPLRSQWPDVLRSAARYQHPISGEIVELPPPAAVMFATPMLETPVYEAGPVVSYKASFSDGWCGVDFFRDNASLTSGKWFGHHIGSDAEETWARVQLFDRDDILRACDLLDDRPIASSPLAPSKFEQWSTTENTLVTKAQCLTFPKNVRVVGVQTDRKKWGSIYSRSRLHATPFNDWHCPVHRSPHLCACGTELPPKAPALLAPYYVHGVRHDPIETLLHKPGGSQPTRDTVGPHSTRDLVLAVSRECAAYFIPPPCVGAPPLYSLDDVLNNRPDWNWFKPLERSTSAGIEHSHVVYPGACGARGKFRVLKCTVCSYKDGRHTAFPSCRYTLVPEVQAIYDEAYEALVDRCEPPSFLWNFFPKDECLSVPKLHPRMILGADVVYQLLVMVLIGPLFSGVTANCRSPDSPIKVGINPLGLDADELFAPLAHLRVLQGDHVAWDLSITALLHTGAHAVISSAYAQYFPRGPLNARSIAALLAPNELIFLMFGPAIIELVNALATGNPTCAVYNSIADLVTILVSWYAFEIDNDRVPTLARFRSLFAPWVYGDDFVLYKLEPSPFTTPLLARYSRELFGCDISSPDKVSALQDDYPATSAEFLKREPVFHHGRWHLALQEKSILRPLFYSRAQVPFELVPIALSVLTELCNSGDQVAYDENHDFLVQWFLSKNVFVYLPTFDEMLLQLDAPQNRIFTVEDDYDLPEEFFSDTHPQSAEDQKSSGITETASAGDTSSEMTTVAESTPIIHEEVSQPISREIYALMVGKFAPKIVRLPSEITERWVTIPMGSWASATAGQTTATLKNAPTAIGTLKLPFDVFDNAPVIKNHAEYFTLFRFKAIEVKISFTSTQFNFGTLLAAFQPLYDGTIDKRDCYASLICMGGIFLDANMASSHCITTKWHHNHAWMRMTDINTWNSMHGQLCLYIWNKLRTGGASLVTSLPIHIMARFVDLELANPDGSTIVPLQFSQQLTAARHRASLAREAGSIVMPRPSSAETQAAISSPTKPQSEKPAKEGAKKLDKTDVKQPKAKATTEQKVVSKNLLVPPIKFDFGGHDIPVLGQISDFLGGLFSGVANTATGLIGSLGGGAGIGAAAGGIGKMAPFFLDKPLSIASPQPTYEAAGTDLLSGQGVQLATPLSLRQNPYVDLRFGGHPDIKRLAQRPSVTAIISFSNATAAKALLFSSDVAPGPFASPSSSGVAPNIIWTFLPNWSFWAARMYRYWRGSFKVALHISCSGITSCRLRWVLLPAGTNPLSDPETYGNDVFGGIIEVRGTAIYPIFLPYMNQRAFLGCPPIAANDYFSYLHSAGQFYLYLQTPPVGFDANSDTTVSVTVLTAFAEDVQLFDFVGSSYQGQGNQLGVISSPTPRPPRPRSIVIEEVLDDGLVEQKEVAEGLFGPTKPQMDILEVFSSTKFNPPGDATASFQHTDLFAPDDPTSLSAILRRSRAAPTYAQARYDAYGGTRDTDWTWEMRPFMGWRGGMIYSAFNPSAVYHSFQGGQPSATHAQNMAAGSLYAAGATRPHISAMLPWVRTWLFEYPRTGATAQSFAWDALTGFVPKSLSYIATSYTNSFLWCSATEDTTFLLPQTPGLMVFTGYSS